MKQVKRAMLRMEEKVPYGPHPLLLVTESNPRKEAEIAVTNIGAHVKSMLRRTSSMEKKRNINLKKASLFLK